MDWREAQEEMELDAQFLAVDQTARKVLFKNFITVSMMMMSYFYYTLKLHVTGSKTQRSPQEEEGRAGQARGNTKLKNTFLKY